jgi:GTP-binding protein
MVGKNPSSLAYTGNTGAPPAWPKWQADHYHREKIMQIHWQKAKFVRSCILPESYPALVNSTGNPIPQIAVAGRSNVGKSSLLNDLFQVKGLVKTSSTPGKTQMINFFSIEDALLFVDLPGYGYAKVPPEMKKQWGPMVQKYFVAAQGLRLLILLLDIRRIPNEEDFQLIEWAAWAKRPLQVIFSKADKVSQSERIAQEKKIGQILDLTSVSFLHYSSKTHLGRLELRKIITENIVG